MQQSGSQLGFLVTDIDCTNPSEEDMKRIKSALFEHGMILLRNQNLDRDQQVAFTRKFGELIERPDYYAKNYREPGYPSIIRIGTVGQDGQTIPKAMDAEDWHKDGAFEQPGQDFIVSILHPKLITKVGGQTGFADCEDTYNRLPEEFKEKLEGAKLLVTSKTSSFFSDAQYQQHYPDAHHPIFQVHPVSKRNIHFLSRISEKIILKNGEIVDITPYVDELEKYQDVYCHQWEEGDLVIWDNYRVVHKGMGGFGDSKRLLFRTQVRLKLQQE